MILVGQESLMKTIVIGTSTIGNAITTLFRDSGHDVIQVGRTSGDAQADVDRAKSFYARLGRRQDADLAVDESYRIVQFTPPGSPASIIFGTGVTTMAPGSVQDLMLIVSDVDAAREELVRCGADVSETWHDTTGIFHHADTQTRVPGRDPHRNSYRSWASFADPDGNGWLLQEITERLPGRVD
jgi:catechol 2,3-dioxygenase-like lactoylglutathione lyase family enzyme